MERVEGRDIQNLLSFHFKLNVVESDKPSMRVKSVVWHSYRVQDIALEKLTCFAIASSSSFSRNLKVTNAPAVAARTKTKQTRDFDRRTNFVSCLAKLISLDEPSSVPLFETVSSLTVLPDSDMSAAIFSDPSGLGETREEETEKLPP
jgi:hypothetical protein